MSDFREYAAQVMRDYQFTKMRERYEEQDRHDPEQLSMKLRMLDKMYDDAEEGFFPLSEYREHVDGLLEAGLIVEPEQEQIHAEHSDVGPEGQHRDLDGGGHRGGGGGGCAADGGSVAE